MARTVLYVVLVCGALVGTGCKGPDVVIQNPITARAVEPNKIVKMHEYAERQRGLPPGSMSDEAQLVSADDQQICFVLSLHELDPIDLAGVEARLSSAKSETVPDPQVWPEEPTFQTYNGLIPIRRQTGVQTYCASYYNNVCTSWATRPIYSTFWRPGPVNVYRTGAKMCFANRGVARPDTEMIVLELKLRRGGVEANRTSGWGAMAGFEKKVAFRWGFPKAK